jgi:adenylate cyclase
MRRGAELLREQSILNYDGLLKIALADGETRAGDVDRALAILDEALATCDRTGHRAFEADLNRVRGEILLKREPANPAAAEEAFQTAIAVAKQQSTRSFELRAALSLAKLYQSTDRPVEAHDALAPALEGFSPRPEMPEIAEAQTLLAALAESEEMKNAAASRQHRLQLQTSYGKALMLSRGFGSEEAKAAFAHARELATGVDNAAERFDAYYGLFIGSLMRGELRLARETAEIFLLEAEKEERTTEAAAARCCLGVACLWQGDLAVARAHFEQALRIFDPERDREAKFRFSMDIGAAATVFLALTNWLLGEAGRAQELIEEAIARAVESAHAPTLAMAYWLKAEFDALRDDAEAARRAAESLLEVSRGHGLALYLDFGALFSAWARARLGDRVTGMTEFQHALAAYAEQGNKLFAPLFQGRLAEFEAAGQDREGALARIDEALALAEQTDQRWTDALLHRIRGDILLKADPENPARAEDAYLAAIAIAREQGARSFGLQAALKLAKLCQSTGRPADAHAVLAPALEGFAPTPEMPEIAEAQARRAELSNPSVG